MDRRDLNLEQLMPATEEKAKHGKPKPLYRPHLESKASVMTTTSNGFSIYSSATPQTVKGKHTMFKAPQPIQFRPYDADLEKQTTSIRDRTVSQAFDNTSKLRAQSLVHVGGLNELH